MNMEAHQGLSISTTIYICLGAWFTYLLYLRQRYYIDRLSMVTFSSILGEIVTNSNIIMKCHFQIEKSDLRNLKILYKLFSMLIPCSHL